MLVRAYVTLILWHSEASPAPPPGRGNLSSQRQTANTFIEICFRVALGHTQAWLLCEKVCGQSAQHRCPSLRRLPATHSLVWRRAHSFGPPHALLPSTASWGRTVQSQVPAVRHPISCCLWCRTRDDVCAARHGVPPPAAVQHMNVRTPSMLCECATSGERRAACRARVASGMPSYSSTCAVLRVGAVPRAALDVCSEGFAHNPWCGTGVWRHTR